MLGLKNLRHSAFLSIACNRVQPIHTCALLQRYKKKWVEMGRKKVQPSELALAYFDTYYPQIYGEKNWNKMREAMLRKKKKYCALVNNFANSQKTVNDLIAEEHAFDMFTITGKKIKSPHPVYSQDEPTEMMDEEPHNDQEDKNDEKWNEKVIDLAASEPKTEEYEETPEGFMVPKKPEMEGAITYLPPDFYDFIPAERRISDKQELEEQIEKQTLSLPNRPTVEVIEGEAVLVPPMLKCHVHPAGVVKEFHSPRQDETKMLEYYLLDAASILPVLALDIRPNDRILDLCSGPGGKTLTMAQTLLPDQIVCVDSSYARMNRLRDTLSWYIPGVFDESEKIAQAITIMQQDGRLLGDIHPDRYDKVLVDVPCNTDRQSLHDNENNRFKRTRVTERLQLPEVQVDLLVSGIRACRPGGTIVYSTCTLTPGQNDFVIEAVVDRLRDEYSDIDVVVQDTSSIRQRLNHVFKFWPYDRYGQIVLPSAEANFGPMFFAKLVRIK